MPQSLHGELDIRHAQQRIHVARIQPDGVVLRGAGARPEAAEVADIELLRLPGLQALFDLLGEALWIRGRAERLFGENRGGLVMAVSIAIRSGEARQQYIGTKG